MRLFFFNILLLVREHGLAEAAPLLLEDLCGHFLKIRGDGGPEAHLGDDVLFDVQTGRYLYEGEHVVYELEDCLLGDVQYALAVRGVLSGEGDLAYLVDELRELGLGLLVEAAKGSDEDYGLGGSSDVNESAGAGNSAAHPGHVVVAVLVDLAYAETGNIQAAAGDHVEHLVRGKDGLGVVSGAEAWQCGRNAAYHTGLGAHDDVVGEAFLVDDAGHLSRHAYAEVYDVALAQLHRSPSEYDLPFVERKRLDGVERLSDLAGECGLPVVALCLPAVLGIVVPDHVVDQVAGDLDVLGVERLFLCEVLYLDYYDTAAVLYGVGHCEAFVYNGFVCEGNVAVLVCDGSSEQSHVHLEGRIEQVLFAVELYEFYDFVAALAGSFVHLAAFNARVYEGTQTDLGDESGTACAYLAPQVDDDALREAEACQLVCADLVAEGVSACYVCAGPLGYEAGACLAEAVHAADTLGCGIGIRTVRVLAPVPADELVAEAPVAQG